MTELATAKENRDKAQRMFEAKEKNVFDAHWPTIVRQINEAVAKGHFSTFYKVGVGFHPYLTKATNKLRELGYWCTFMSDRASSGPGICIQWSGL